MAFDWQAAMSHPLTLMGAGMMMGADPRRTGFGGIGAGILTAQQRMSEREQFEDERERQRRLADLQAQTFQAKLAQQQRESQAMEAYAAQNPAMAAQIRAGVMPSDFQRKMAMVGNDPERFKQAFGGGPLVQIGDETKLPTGYMWKNPADKSQGVTPIPGGPKTQRSGETAGKEAMIDVALSLVPNVNELVFKDGDPSGEINREVLAEKAAARAGVPGVMVPEGSQLAQNMEVGIQAITRIETGAAMPPNELANTRTRFEPNVFDADEVIRLKLKAYDLFMRNAKRYLDPTTGTVDVDLAMADAAKEIDVEMPEPEEAEAGQAEMTPAQRALADKYGL